MKPIEIDEDDLDRVERLAYLAGGARTSMSLVNGLPQTQRHAVVAPVLEERDYSEIARDLRCSKAVVRQASHEQP